MSLGALLCVSHRHLKSNLAVLFKISPLILCPSFCFVLAMPKYWLSNCASLQVWFVLLLLLPSLFFFFLWCCEIIQTECNVCIKIALCSLLWSNILTVEDVCFCQIMCSRKRSLLRALCMATLHYHLSYTYFIRIETLKLRADLSGL